MDCGKDLAVVLAIALFSISELFLGEPSEQPSELLTLTAPVLQLRQVEVRGIQGLPMLPQLVSHRALPL